MSRAALELKAAAIIEKKRRRSLNKTVYGPEFLEPLKRPGIPANLNLISLRPHRSIFEN